MPNKKEIIGGPLIINGRQLSLSRAVRAGDFVFLTGQVPLKDGKHMTTGTIEAIFPKAHRRARHWLATF